MRKRPERAFPFLRGCAGMSDRRERKATPSGVFDWTQSGQSGAWGTPTGVLENPKRIFQYIARRYYRKFLIS